MGSRGGVSAETQTKIRLQYGQSKIGHQKNSQYKWVAVDLCRLAYNPITLEYDKNPQGERLKRLDEQSRIRGFVRAHNIDHYGNSKYNPLNG